MPYMFSWKKEHNRQMLHIHQNLRNAFCCGGCHTKKEDNNNEVESQQKRQWDKTEITKLEINKVTIF